jgi:RecA-family ATPase
MLMNDENQMTAQNPAVGAAGEQSVSSKPVPIITTADGQNNEILKSHIDDTCLDAISMADLYENVYQPRLPVVDGLLNTGTYLFVGAPKVGKSFFMAQLAYHVSMGIPLWEYPVRKGTVLYLALEDDYARLQQRLSTMFGVEGSRDFFMAVKARNLAEGLDEQMEAFVRDHPDARLIIIDTLQKIREAGGDKYSYANDYEIVTKLKNFSDKHNICLLVVHHTRKMESSDSFDMISGTNGLLGAADGAFIMQKKKRTDNEATLSIVGRDQQDQELTLDFDREHCTWNMTNAETELWKAAPDPLLEEIKDFFSGKDDWTGTASELLEQLPKACSQIKSNVLTRKLNVNVGRLYKEYGICYEPLPRTSDRKLIKLTRKTE